MTKTIKHNKSELMEICIELAGNDKIPLYSERSHQVQLKSQMKKKHLLNI